MASLDALSFFQPEHDQQHETARLEQRGVRAGDRWFGGQRDRQIERLADLEAPERRRRDADDRDWDVVDQQRLANNIRRAAKPTPPECVADHPDRSAARPIVIVRQHASQRGADAQRPEETAARVDSAAAPCRRPHRRREPLPLPGERAGDERRSLAERLPHLVVPAGARLESLVVREIGRDPHQLIGSRDRKGAKEDAVDDRKHRGVRADRDGERQDGDGREETRRQQRAEGESKILEEAQVQKVARDRKVRTALVTRSSQPPVAHGESREADEDTAKQDRQRDPPGAGRGDGDDRRERDEPEAADAIDRTRGQVDRRADRRVHGPVVRRSAPDRRPAAAVESRVGCRVDATAIAPSTCHQNQRRDGRSSKLLDEIAGERFVVRDNRAERRANRGAPRRARGRRAGFMCASAPVAAHRSRARPAPAACP